MAPEQLEPNAQSRPRTPNDATGSPSARHAAASRAQCFVTPRRRAPGPESCQSGSVADGHRRCHRPPPRFVHRTRLWSCPLQTPEPAARSRHAATLASSALPARLGHPLPSHCSAPLVAALRHGSSVAFECTARPADVPWRQGCGTDLIVACILYTWVPLRGTSWQGNGWVSLADSPLLRGNPLLAAAATAACRPLLVPPAAA
eukprot:COSAG04_NODE_658_length_11475_cov_3.480837_11_plen_203_part_00